MGWYIYKDSIGNPVFLDDVVSEDNPNNILKDKLPKELAQVEEMRFCWDKKRKQYVLKLKR